jgi:ketosteroid isomerase-like protein
LHNRSRAAKNIFTGKRFPLADSYYCAVDGILPVHLDKELFAKGYANMIDLPAHARAHFQAVVEKRVADIIDHYTNSESLYVFVEGPRWSTIGFERVSTGWRAFHDAPLSVTAVEWIEGPFFQATEQLAWIAGITELHVQVGDEHKAVRFRGTFVLQPESDGQWRIVHEHFSQPAADPYGIGDWLKPS